MQREEEQEEQEKQEEEEEYQNPGAIMALPDPNSWAPQEKFWIWIRPLTFDGVFFTLIFDRRWGGSGPLDTPENV